jgi:hypothetical protein
MANLEIVLTGSDESAQISTLIASDAEFDQKSELVYGLTLNGVSNPAFIEFLRMNTEFCDSINHEILLHPACPDRIKIIFAQHSQCDEVLARLLTEPGTSRSVQDAFDLKKRDADAEVLLRETFEGLAQEDQDKALLEAYLQERTPFFLPVFANQDITNLEHRTASLIGGVPFTNSEFEWPKGPDRVPMQPIVQINLSDAQACLNLDLRGGLVQVWARQIEGGWEMGKGWPDNEDDDHFLLRVIPKSALQKVSQPLVVGEAPWDKSIEQLEMDVLRSHASINEHPCLIIHSQARIDNPRIDSWRYFGSMFTPRYDNSINMLGEASFDFSVEFFAEYPVESISNPDSGYILNACYLGGYGGGHGGQNEAYPLKLRDGREAQLLFNYRSEGDSYTAVTFSLYFVLDDQGPSFGFQYYRYA